MYSTSIALPKPPVTEKSVASNFGQERDFIALKQLIFPLLLVLLDRSQNYALHFICITFHLHYISFAFKNHATSAQNA